MVPDGQRCASCTVLPPRGLAPANKRDEVIKRFVRLDESRSKPGTGLGLSLVEAVMELHGGSLRLSDTDPDNAQAPGLTVSMVFPVTTP
jgi:signal transduction histidine kinase